MNQIGRRFALSERPGSGVSCNENGLFVSAVPLLEPVSGLGPIGQRRWQPRPVSELNRDLSKCYGLPVEFGRKIDGLTAVARALNRGDVIHAQIATLHLQIPDPQALTKSTPVSSQIIDLARQLLASGLLKEDWDPRKHPRWPAGSPDSIGGRFAPADAVSDESASGESSDAPVIPAQITIPAPFPAPFELPGGIPFPSEVVPPPAIPNVNPRDLPRNPYPDRPECEQEWAEATRFCLKLQGQNLLGRGDYRGMGRTLSECIMGQVSEDCGGNETGA